MNNIPEKIKNSKTSKCIFDWIKTTNEELSDLLIDKISTLRNKLTEIEISEEEESLENSSDEESTDFDINGGEQNLQFIKKVMKNLKKELKPPLNILFSEERKFSKSSKNNMIKNPLPF